ncbi:hypothetical protein I4641_13210, partial [Waterburya agarophytonicola K14]|nr:hypothetical protein [Waterburya agarophytonicola KI4]
FLFSYRIFTLLATCVRQPDLIQYQIDNLVWSIATSIYRQSGHKVDFSSVRDLANTRIKSLKMLAVRQAEEAKQKALEEEAIKIEQARLKAEAEAKKKAKEEARKIEQARQKEINKDKAEGVYWSKTKADSNIYLFREVFEEIKKIIAKELEIESDRITPESHMYYDLGAECENDVYKIALEIEEEFDIEFDLDNYSLDCIKDLCDFVILNI